MQKLWSDFDIALLRCTLSNTNLRHDFVLLRLTLNGIKRSLAILLLQSAIEDLQVDTAIAALRRKIPCVYKINGETYKVIGRA